MKKYIKLLLGACFLFQLIACEYLDVVPDERAQESDTYNTANAVKAYLYSCYGFMPSSRDWPGSYWIPEEVTAVSNELFTNLKRGVYSPVSLDYTSNTWGNIWNGIRQCYMFQSVLSKVSPDIVDDDTKKLYLAESNFMIAYYHFLSLRSYGPTMIIREALSQDMPIEQFPERSTYDEVVQFINDKLDEAIPNLPDKQLDADFGRASRLIALGLKSRMYLYAASPLFNGNSKMYSNFRSPVDGRHLISQEYSIDKWQKSADVTLAAINELDKSGFRLYDDLAAGEPDNKKPGLPNKAQRRLQYTTLDYNENPEVIWAECKKESRYGVQRRSVLRRLKGADKEDLGTTIVPTLQSVESFYTKNGLPIDRDKTFNYPARYDYIAIPDNCDGNNYGNPTGKVMRLHTDREPRFYAWVGYHNGYYEMSKYEDKDPGNGDPAKRAVLIQMLKNDPHGQGNRTSGYSITGYANKKWAHPGWNGSWVDYPFCLMRLGELYLNYAEALVELNRLDEAKIWLNKIRSRAGIPDVDEAWDKYSTTPGYQNTQEGLREIVRQERMNELYFEGHKFLDISRWIIADKYENVPDRGLNIRATKIEDFTPIELTAERSFHKGQYLMPIDQKEINKAPQIVQNPFYE